MSNLRMTRRDVLRTGGAVAGMTALGAIGTLPTSVSAQATPVSGGELISTLNVGDIS